MTSTDDSTQIQVVSADGSSSSDINKTNSDSSRTTTYEDLVQYPDLFWNKLREFLEYTDKPLKVPVVGGNSLNLHQLFVQVTARGGIERVIKERRCKEVIETFAFKTKVTNASFVVKKNYTSMLFKFEHVFYLKKPVSSFAAREEELSSLLGTSRKHKNELAGVGSLVSGIIEGKFDNGYFVSVKMDSTELTGVLYEIDPEETKNRKKRPKSSDKPKSHRSGYNFFFSENYKRLKPLYVGRGKLLTQEIVQKWKNLSAFGRQAYQEQGAKDRERYNREMLVYRALMDARAAAEAEAKEIDVAAEAEAVEADAATNDATDSEATDSDATDSDAAMNDAEETDSETETE